MTLLHLLELVKILFHSTKLYVVLENTLVFVYVDMSLTSGQRLAFLWETDVYVIRQVDHLLLHNHGSNHSFEVNFQEAISQAILLLYKDQITSFPKINLQLQGTVHLGTNPQLLYNYAVGIIIAMVDGASLRVSELDYLESRSSLEYYTCFQCYVYNIYAGLSSIFRHAIF